MAIESTKSALERVALLGNYLPRRCGIATFTSDLASAISGKYPKIACPVVAITDPGNQYSYERTVCFEIQEADLGAYRRAADYLNMSGADVLSVQHEYGIFGGRAGSHLLALLGEVRMPVVTTLHTILSAPSAAQRRVLDEVIRLSDRLVVMSQRGAELLQEVHKVPAEKIDFIPHGVPVLPSREASRERLGVGDTFQLLTFGLLSPDKGLEFVIDALPDLVARHPELRYVIVGATHPHILAQQGETYRRSLQQRAHKLGVEDNVVFYDRFVEATELGEFLSAADVYITPYLNPEQITSGTLAYALGNGQAIISTPYRYAEEVLAEGRGILVPMRDSAALGRAVDGLINHPEELQGLRERARAYGRPMTWPSVAAQYVATLERAQREHGGKRGVGFLARKSLVHPVTLPALDLRHLETLTDRTGIFQHAQFSVPRYADGYCTDDNARALLLVTLIEEAGTCDRKTTHPLASTYLAFVAHALQDDTGRFSNFMSFDRRWVEKAGSDDSHARAMWALGTVVARAPDPLQRALAGRLFRTALPTASHFGGPRPLAFTLLGLCEYLAVSQGDREVEAIRRLLARRLLDYFHGAASGDWIWCEDELSYDNARLPQALIRCGHELGDEEMTAMGLSSLDWLLAVQRDCEGCFRPIGSNGFYKRRGEPAIFDQQPVEACATVSACLDAWRVTGVRKWTNEMWRAFSWLLGENILHAPLYDAGTGGCRDGLHADRPNENQGAESTLSFLLALTDMSSLEAEAPLARSCR